MEKSIRKPTLYQKVIEFERQGNEIGEKLWWTTEKKDIKNSLYEQYFVL